jgi:PAS domain-containing protein
LRRASGPRPPEVRLDLRVPFAVERRLLPALLLVGVIAAASGTAAGATSLIWIWFALYAANAAARYLLATTYGDARRSLGAEASCARPYVASVVVDFLLWAALLLAVPQPASFVAGPGAFAAGGALLLAALSFGTWPRVWSLYIAAWVVLLAAVAVRISGTLTSFAFVFPLWLLACWWLGRQQPLARLAERNSAQTLMSNPTKFGWQAAIHSMPTPVIVARNGRIIEVNRSACEYIGKSERAILATPLAECLIATPPEALQPEQHRSESSAEVEIKPADRTFDGALWGGRVSAITMIEEARPGSM